MKIRDVLILTALLLKINLTGGFINYATTRSSMSSFSSQFSDIPSAFSAIGDEIREAFTTVVTDKTRVEAYCLSDMHADSLRNQQWARDHCFRPKEADGAKEDVFTVMIVPGDIGTEIESLGTVFGILAENYDAVVYCVGNHECWRRGTASGGSASHPEARTPGTNRQARNSIEKIIEVLKCAKSKGVHVGPYRVVSETAGAGEGVGLTIMPLQSWYHSGWDKEPDLTDDTFLAVEDAIPFSRRWGDFAQCLWPGIVEHEDFASIKRDSLALPRAFASLNVEYLEDEAFMESARKDTILSFSHFLPRQELCPEKRFLLEPSLAKVIGSDPLEAQVRQLKPHLHMFGHTHIPIDLSIDGIRYLQWPLGYQREADKQCMPVYVSGPLLVYDSELRRTGAGDGSGIPAEMPSQQVQWTLHYLEHSRDPSNQQLAPWLTKRLESFSGLVESKKKDESHLAGRRAEG